MNRRSQKEAKGTPSLLTYFPKPTPPEDKTPPPTAAKIDTPKSEPKKKPCSSLNQYLLAKERPPLRQPLWLLLRTAPLLEVLQQCEGVRRVVEGITEKSGLKAKAVESLLKKYLQSNTHSLWSHKYAPQSGEELFDSKAGQLIREWLTAYFQLRSQVSEDSESYPTPEEGLLGRVRERSWRLAALVVQGEAGTGKSAAVRAVAKTMGVELQECGNDYNQTKYLKQKNESTQSESVKTAYSKAPRPQPHAQMITKFLTAPERPVATELRKAQLLHNVGQIYPETEAAKFYCQLGKCIELSKIPFIMTANEQVPKECSNYDVIEFGPIQTNKAEKFFWVIYHLERLLPLNRMVEVEPARMMEELQAQTQQADFRELCAMAVVKQVCQVYDYRLDVLFTCLQQNANLAELDVAHLWLQKRKLCQTRHLLKMAHTLARPIQLGYKVELNTQDSEHSEEEDLHGKLRKLRVLTAEDTVFVSDEHPHLARSSLPADPPDLHTAISPALHHQIRSDIARTLNAQIQLISDRFRSTLQPRDLPLLPMLAQRRRSSRGGRGSEDVLRCLNDGAGDYVRAFVEMIRGE